MYMYIIAISSHPAQYTHNIRSNSRLSFPIFPFARILSGTRAKKIVETIIHIPFASSRFSEAQALSHPLSCLFSLNLAVHPPDYREYE